MSETTAHPDYFRRDQDSGISPPDLTKDCTYAEHIVHARGKRTQFTSVSHDRTKITQFGETLYSLHTEAVLGSGHLLVTYDQLIAELQNVIQTGDKAERQRAIQAKRYAVRAKEALVDWRFDIQSVARKDRINWAKAQVQRFFQKV
jgi:hypothetical protein